MNDLPPVSSSSEQVDESRRTRRDVVMAGVILGFLAAGLVGYFTFFSTQDTDHTTLEISAASWVGRGAEDNETKNDVPESTPVEQKRDDVHYYAPTPEELAAPVHDLTEEEEQASLLDQSVKHGTVQKGLPVIKSLGRLGLSIGDAHELISALDGIFDFRTARPGQAFEIHVDPQTQKVTFFRYEVSITEVYEVRRKGEGLKGSRKHIPTEKKQRRYAGTIASSLYQALKELGAHPSLSGRIVEVLAHQVDFYKAQRPGDTFRVVVEEEKLKDNFLGYGPVLALEYNGIKSGKKRFFRFAAGDDVATYYSEKGISVPRSVISIPLHYTRISSQFGRRYHPILKHKKLHNGVDFAAPNGTPVWACQAGKVTCASRKGANGNLVIIAHKDNLISYYAHLLRFSGGIKPGAAVRERQVVGYVGSTGRSTGPHLHFGLKKGGRFIDPLKYKVRPGRPVAIKYRTELKTIISEWSKLLDRTSIQAPASALADMSDQDAEDVLGLEDLE